MIFIIINLLEKTTKKPPNKQTIDENLHFLKNLSLSLSLKKKKKKKKKNWHFLGRNS